MEIILLERIEKLGHIGDIVNVRAGFARNYLLPQSKALISNKENRIYFENQKAIIEAQNLKNLQEAENIAGKIDGKELLLLCAAGESGTLYGSVSARDIVQALKEQLGIDLARSQILMEKPIKSLGIIEQKLRLHAELSVVVLVNVAISKEQAKKQKASHQKTRVPQTLQGEKEAVENSKTKKTKDTHAVDTHAVPTKIIADQEKKPAKETTSKTSKDEKDEENTDKSDKADKNNG